MADEEFEAFFQGVLEKIKERRKELGLTQGQLGELMGKPQSAIARIESGGVKDPGISMLFQVCKALNITPGEIVNGAYFEALNGTSGDISLSDTDWLMRKLATLPEPTKEKVKYLIDEIIRLAGSSSSHRRY